MIECPKHQIKQKIRQINFANLKIGGDSAIAFMTENDNRSKAFLGLEVPYVIEDNFPKVVKDFWAKESCNFLERLEKAQKTDCDLISVKFNITDENLDKKIEEISALISEIYKIVQKPIILRGANNKNVDAVLVKKLAELAQRQSIIAFADDNSYKDIASITAKNGHILVLRSPIDINLAKELNVLANDEGMDLNKLLIDPDMGGLGYGIDYGYSIVEKIKQAGFDGDTMLNMPIIVFAGEEAFKAKESKSTNFDGNWGEYKKRAIMWEIATATPMISAGANIVILWHPESIKVIKGLIE